MPCYHPLSAYKLDNGAIVFAERGKVNQVLTLPCGQCIGCRLERSRQWAIRCMHEAKMHRFNCFITLTYNDEHLPENGQLCKEHVVRFLKRLRKALSKERGAFLSTQHTNDNTTRRYGASPHTPAKVRFYMAGEYGEQFQRPHYHLCLFGIDFSDKKHLFTSKSGSRIYRSPTLEKLWTFGHSSVGALTFESAAYTARYVMKKVNGKHQKQHYERINPETGEIYQLTPEYNNMSRMPGIGKTAFDTWANDWYPQGKIIVRGKPSNTPRYYNKLHAKTHPLRHEEFEHFRQLEGRLHHQDQTDARLKVREEVATAKISKLKRTL